MSLTIRRRRANHSRALVDVSQCAPSPGDAAEEHAFQHAYDSCWFERVSVDVKPSPLVRHWVRG